MMLELQMTGLEKSTTALRLVILDPKIVLLRRIFKSVMLFAVRLHVSELPECEIERIKTRKNNLVIFGLILMFN